MTNLKKALKNKKRHLKCDDCGNVRASVLRQDCPYAIDMYDEKVRCKLCFACAKGRVADV